ncbi:MAG: cache domain-containing protein [Sphingomonadales bacterium]|nr:cache domain-containing protein [Sphingomonadales bacterium]MDE2569853.1 cache domain-containing protein [Sphingomonadales bacterium]
MTKIPRILLAGAFALALGTTAQAAPHATSGEARALLDKAVTEINTVGPDKAFAEFDAGKGAYNTGELYVFVLSMKGVYEAYGANPKLVGHDVSAMTDAEGKPIVRDMIALAKGPGHGKINYVWLNRADNRIEHKSSLIKRVGDHVVGVGYYPN